MKMRNILAVLITAMLSGCMSLEGPRQIIRPEGITVRPNSDTASLVTRFSIAARNAFPGHLDVEQQNRDTTRTQVTTTQPRQRQVTTRTGPNGEQVTVETLVDETRESTTIVRDPRPPLPLQPSQTEVREFLDSGFALVYANCDDYFWTMGQYQTGARVGRDAIAPIVSLLTGLIPLGAFTDNADRQQGLLQRLALGSAFATSALDNYDAHFLFGAENIDSIRTLTSKALGEHRTAVAGMNISNPYVAAMQLIDHQALCTPAHILSLAREAISDGRVAARVAGGTSGRQDLDFRRSVGAALGLPGPVTHEQAFALWWYFENPTEQADKESIFNFLLQLGDASPLALAADGKTIVASTTFTTAQRAALLQALASIPEPTRARYATQIGVVRANVAAAQTAQSTGGAAPPPLAPLVVQESGASDYQHVEVSIPD